MAANMNGGRKKKKDKETERQTFVLAGDVWLAAAESGLDVRQAVNWQKQGRRFSPPPPQLQRPSFTVGCPELPTDKGEKKQLVWQPRGL